MRYFEDLYSQYPRPYGDGPSPVAKDLSKILEKGSKVVDLGCGTGRDCIFLAKKGMKVTGVDLSMRAIMAAQMWARDEKVEVRFLNKDLLENGLKDKEFDAILCVNTLEYLHNRKHPRVGHEIYRIANEGAYLGLMTRSTDDPDLQTGKDIGDNTWEVSPGLSVHFFTDREIKALFPDFNRERMEVVSVNESIPKPTEHKYWLLLGCRP